MTEHEVNDLGDAEPTGRRHFLGAFDRVDAMLTGSGIALAAFAAFFPWYVVFHRESFTINHDGMAQNLKRDLPIGPPRAVYSVSPSASININAQGVVPSMDPETLKRLDKITTATVPDNPQAKSLAPNDGAELNQPLPGNNKGFRLLHVSGDRALIEDPGGMYMVSVGAVLPDNSHLASIEQRDGGWVLVTSNGDVIGMN